MRKKMLAFVLAVAMAVSSFSVPVMAQKKTVVITTANNSNKGGSNKGASSNVPTEQEAYNAMIALKRTYPEGMKWTEDNSYKWKGGIYSTGTGCSGFAFILSDAAFRRLPARKEYYYTFADVRVGDILRMYNNSHSAIVIERTDSYFVLAEGNYGGTIHWGRVFSSAEYSNVDYVLTRYPQ